MILIVLLMNIFVYRYGDGKLKKKLNEKIERFCSQKALQVSIMNIKRYIKFY